MKKVFLIAAFAVLTMGVSHAQEGFALGARVALPIGDFGDVSSFGAGLEAMYFMPINDGLKVGGSLGYTTYVVDDIETPFGTVELDNISFLPVAAKAIFSLGDSGFGLGADLGYAIGLNDGNDGGLLYEPKVIYDTSLLLFSLGYQGIEVDGGSLNSLQLAAAFKF